MTAQAIELLIQRSDFLIGDFQLILQAITRLLAFSQLRFDPGDIRPQPGEFRRRVRLIIRGLRAGLGRCEQQKQGQ